MEEPSPNDWTAREFSVVFLLLLLLLSCFLDNSNTEIGRGGGGVKLQSCPDSYCFKPNSIAFLILQVT